MDYVNIISLKYNASPDAFEVVWMPDPAQMQPGSYDEADNFIPPDNSGVPIIPVITYWNLPDPQPTFAELDEYADSPAYLAAWGAKAKAEAEAKVNAWANQMVVKFKIIEPELFYVAMVSNIAFRLLEWNALGQPEEVDPARFMVTHAEAQAYAETSGPGMTAAELLRLQEQKWSQMQQGFAMIVYKRRLALERIKLAAVGEGLEGELAGILAVLNS